jgi:hypothetical protein
MKINKIYLSRFKKYSYGYMFMIKRGVFLLFDKDTLEYKGVLNMIPYKEMQDVYPTIEKLVALDYLEV